MSEFNPDGGPAFPSHGSMGEVAHEGMTLRDYLAAKAMEAIYMRFGGSPSAGNNHDGVLDLAASDAYAMADAMLRAKVAK